MVSVTVIGASFVGVIKLLVTNWLEILTAAAPEGVCNGFVAGFVYDTDIASPDFTALAIVSWTLAPEMATLLTAMTVELTFMLNDEAAGTIELFSDRL
jgi:hypothetical protein